MDVELHEWPMGTRACRFSLCLQGGCVYADFDLDADERAYVVRMSFDGYGCCNAPDDIGRMSSADSAALLAMVRAGHADERVEPLLRRYFRSVAAQLWEDALREHDVV